MTSHATKWEESSRGNIQFCTFWHWCIRVNIAEYASKSHLSYNKRLSALGQGCIRLIIPDSQMLAMEYGHCAALYKHDTNCLANYLLVVVNYISLIRPM